jgi:transposase
MYQRESVRRTRRSRRSRGYLAARQEERAEDVGGEDGEGAVDVALRDPQHHPRPGYRLP